MRVALDTRGVGGQFYEISDPDGAVEFAVVDGEIRRLDDNLLPAAWSDIAKGLVQKATNAEAAVDALLPWGSGTALNEDLGMTPALTRVLVEENYLIRNSITYSVGPSGSADFVDLNEAFEFLDGKTLASGANVYLALEPGRILHTKSIVINHPQALRIHIQGAPMLGAVPTKDDFTGDQTLDLAMLRSRFAVNIWKVIAFSFL